jgi:hypothetical protein
LSRSHCTTIFAISASLANLAIDPRYRLAFDPTR